MKPIIELDFSQPDLKDILKFDMPYESIRFAQIEKYSMIFITASMEPKEEWNFKIFENSNYCWFSLEKNGKLELGSRVFGLKFRACTVKSIEDAKNCIQKYLDEAMEIKSLKILDNPR